MRDHPQIGEEERRHPQITQICADEEKNLPRRHRGHRGGGIWSFSLCPLWAFVVNRRFPDIPVLSTLPKQICENLRNLRIVSGSGEF
jgi:hypothetical protein